MRMTKLTDAEPRPRRIAVGEFDGVHLGHREVIRGSDTVLTFEPHPLRVVRLTDEHGLIALAEADKRPGLLKPIVVLRPEDGDRE